MRTIKFPNMFSANSNTNVWKSSEHLAATKQSTILLLHSERGELFGDPYFGLKLRHYLYDQNSAIMRDILADMIYRQVAIFIPQVYIQRKDVEVWKDKELGKVYCSFFGINQIDYQLNTFNLILYDESNEGNKA